MIEATYLRPDGGATVLENRVRSCVDHRASIEHKRATDLGWKLVACTLVNVQGRVELTRDIGSGIRQDPEEQEPRPLGIEVSRVRNRSL